MEIHIEPADLGDSKEVDEIMEVWESSVRATHHFLDEENIRRLKNDIRNEYLRAVELFVARERKEDVAGKPLPGKGKILAFLGLSPEKIEMLFVSAGLRGKGIGKQLTLFAIREKGISKVDVNEQNEQALGFYQFMGFKVIARSEVDSQGNSFPLLLMQR